MAYKGVKRQATLLPRLAGLRWSGVARGSARVANAQEMIEREWRGIGLCACGYDLRATAMEGRCPECGVWLRELVLRRLSHADVHWLMRLRRGMVWMVMGYIVAIAAAVVVRGLTYQELEQLWNMPEKPWLLLLWLRQVEDLCVGFGPMALVVGSWYLSEREDRRRSPWLWLSAAGIFVYSLPMYDLSPRLAAVIPWEAGHLDAALFAAWYCLLAWRLRYLARRMEARWLERWCWLLGAGLAVSSFLDFSKVLDWAIALVMPAAMMVGALMAAAGLTPWEVDYYGWNVGEDAMLVKLVLLGLTLTLFWGLLNMAILRIEFRVTWGGWRMGPMVRFRRAAPLAE